MKPIELSRKIPWGWAPYGSDNRRCRRIERSKRKQETQKLIKEQTS